MSEDTEKFTRDLNKMGLKKRKGDDVWEGSIIGKAVIMQDSEHYFTLSVKLKMGDESDNDSTANIIMVSAPIKQWSGVTARELTLGMAR